MPPSAPHILLVEDTETLALMYAEYMRSFGYDVSCVDTGAKALAWLDKNTADAMVLDLLLPDTNGLEILSKAQISCPNMPVVVVTVLNSVTVAVDAIRKGAFDYLVKPFDPPRLSTTLRNALSQNALSQELKELRLITGLDRYHGFVGQSAPMQAMYRLIDTVAPSKASVFITGESGTGKELAAQALHTASPRRNKPFITLNCAAIPQDLVESTLFGHVRGAFTGAVSDLVGAARQAHGGTLFLDEIGEMPLEMQTKFLRFCQTGEILPVGSGKAETVDVRLVVATNRNIHDEVRAKRFREDLFYRLHIIPMTLPPLRERHDDLEILAHHFMVTFNQEENKSFLRIDPEVISLFRRYDWPGNVRQLENVLRNVIVLHDQETITPDILPNDFQRFAQDHLTCAANQNCHDLLLNPSGIAPCMAISPLWLSEKEAIERALHHTGQDITRAALLLEVSPSTIYRKLQLWRNESPSTTASP